MFDVKPYRQELERLCKKYGVKELALFGSALRDDFAGCSDIDFTYEFFPMPPVEYARAYFGLLEDLEKLFGRHVDLVSLKAIRNPYSKASLESSKETVFLWRAH